MSNQSLTPILRQAYNRYFLKFGKIKVQTPYRINIPFQEDRTKYGKSDPVQLRREVINTAKIQNFDLNSANSTEIRDFMARNMLGIDCSGFAYNTLDYLLKKTKSTTMKALGFPKAFSTNVLRLISRKFTVQVPSFKKIKPGDLVASIKSANPGDQHIVLVLNKTKRGINLISSSFDAGGVEEYFLSKRDLIHNTPSYKIRRLKALLSND